jgi:hypothetical protein
VGVTRHLWPVGMGGGDVERVPGFTSIFHLAGSVFEYVAAAARPD